MKREEIKTWTKKKLMKELRELTAFLNEPTSSYSAKDFIFEQWLIDELRAREVLG